MVLFSIALHLMLMAYTGEAQVGQGCITIEGQPGRCLSIRECSQLQVLLSEVRAGQASLEELRGSICHLGREIFLCCPHSKSVAPAAVVFPSAAVAPSVLPTTSTDSSQAGSSGGSALLPEKCGVQGITDRIIGGHPAPLGAWPWVVALRGSDSSGRSLWFCGGTLISERYVVSAAHCFEDRFGIKLEFARVGELNFKENPDCKFEKCAPQPQDILVERIIKHPSYNSPCPQCNDIALLRLSRPAVLSRYVLPICLPLNLQQDLGFTEQEFQGKAAWAAGWGKILPDPRSVTRPDILQQVQLPIQELPICTFLRRSYPDQRMVLCAGGDRRDTCKGDSGGPLTLSNSFGNKYFLVGVTSKGFEICGAQDTQALYTNVVYYLPWILESLQP